MAAAKGNKYATKAKDWENSLRRALARYETGNIPAGTALTRIAFKVVEKALEGDKDAIREIAERLDGKSVQTIESTVTILDRLGESDAAIVLSALDALERGQAALEAGTDTAH